MSEKPKNIWKKPLNGPLGFLAWFIMLFATAFMISLGGDIVWPVNKHVGAIIDSALGRGFILAAGGTMALAFTRWLRGGNNMRRFLFGLACVATLVALVYVEEDWRGRRAWNEFRRQHEATGEKFGSTDYAPAPVRDDQNFALTPVVYSSYGKMLTRDGQRIPENQRDTNFVNRLMIDVVTYDVSGGDASENYAKQPAGVGDWTAGEAADLAKWQSYYRWLATRTNLFPVPPQPQSPARDVLSALSPYDATLGELREAAKLPYSRFPLEYDRENPAEILLPHLSALKHCSLVLRLRATAELQAGETDKAFDDVLLGLQLGDKIRTEPFIITHLVRIAVLQIMLQPVYEGLSRHQWSDAQLAQMETELAGLDFVDDYQRSIRGETAAHCAVIDYFERKRGRFNRFFDLFGGDDQERRPANKFSVYLTVYLAPKGWFDRNKIELTKMNEVWSGVVDASKQMIDPKKAAAALKITGTMGTSPSQFLAGALRPALAGYAQRAAYSQNMANLARIAIALERYRLANGGYPDSLAALSPQFIEKVPHDVINGQSLNYRRTNDGQFVLYSVGWNERDDGGTVVMATGSSPGIDRTKGDWAWRYPAN